MKILVDAKFIELYNGGISSLISTVLPTLKNNRKIKLEILTIFNIKKYVNFFFYYLFTKISRKLQIILYDNFLFNFIANKIKPDIILSFFHDLRLSPEFYGKNFIFIHDLFIFENYKKKNFIQHINDFYYQYTLKRSLKYNPKIITASKTSAKDIIAKLKIKKKSIHIWSQPIPGIFWKNSNFAKSKKKIPVLFYPGGWHPRKNVKLLFDTIEEYNNKYGKLHFRYTSYKNQSNEDLKRLFLLKKKNKLVNLKKISIKKLFNEYKSSNCVIYSTMGEGFGRVLIESVLTRTPIVIPNLKVFKEINKQKEGLFYVKNRNPKQWAELLHKSINFNYKKNSKPNFASLKNFKLKNSAENLLKILLNQKL